MGYITHHTLEILEGDFELISQFREEYDDAMFALEDNGDCCESCKWYDHEIHLRDFSRQHPEALFKLSGLGEENDDIWHEYYKNGKMQRCKAIITFDDFDETKLK